MAQDCFTEAPLVNGDEQCPLFSRYLLGIIGMSGEKTKGGLKKWGTITRSRSLPSHGGGGGGRGGGLGRAVPRCRHIGCVMSHGAAAVLCSVMLWCNRSCTRVIGTCVTYVTCAGRATVTWRRGGGGGASESVPRHVP